MKKDIHPDYRFVVFEDTSNGDRFLGKSTKASKETTTFEGQEYPVIKVATSSNLRKNIIYNTDRVTIFNSSILCFFLRIYRK